MFGLLSGVSLLWLPPLSLNLIPILFCNVRLDHKRPSCWESNQGEGDVSVICNVVLGFAVDHHTWSPAWLSQPSQMIVSNLEKYVLSCQQTHGMADGSVVLLGTDVKLFDLIFGLSLMPRTSRSRGLGVSSWSRKNTNTAVPFVALIYPFLKLMQNLPGANWKGRFTQNCKAIAKSSLAVAACCLPSKKKCFTREYSKGMAKRTCQTSLTFTGSKGGFNQWNKVRSCEFLAVNKLNVIKHTRVSLRRWIDCVCLFLQYYFTE